MSQEQPFSDEKYYEDQIYIGIQYNNLVTSNGDIENNGIPYSFEAGFIKDIPLNKRRNIGLGIGFGYSYDILRPNIIALPNGNSFDFSINNDFSSYKYQSHNLEFPVELRWRTSTSKNSSFWRIYTGGSIIYNVKNEAEFDTGTETVSYTNLDALTKLNYVAYTSIGFSTWNLRLKYYIKSPFKDSTRTTDNRKLNFNQLKIGIVFYLL